MSIKVETKEIMLREEEASDEGNSSSSPSRLDDVDFHDTSGRETDRHLHDDERRRRYGNVYTPSKLRVICSAPDRPGGDVGDVSRNSGGGGDGGVNVPPLLEHKRARNREAASRCRKRKLDRIAALESRVADLNQTNESLLEITSLLTSQVRPREEC